MSHPILDRLNPKKNPVTVSAFVGSIVTIGVVLFGDESMKPQDIDMIKNVLIGFLTILAGYAKD